MTVFLVFLVPVLLLLFFLAAIYHKAFYSNRKKHPPADEMPKGEQYTEYVGRLSDSVRALEKIPFEPVCIKSFDGLKLYGRWYDAGQDAPVAIFFHGYKGNALRDASGGAPFCMARGFSVLLVDQRAHGMSSGRTITFGIKERRDCLSWVEYVTGRLGPNAKIMLMGVSMGAATVMMTADLPLPENVRGIVADCGYSSPEEIISVVAGRMGIPERLAKPFVRMSAILFGGFDIRESSAVAAAAQTDIPMYLIHGTDDRMVPCEMSRMIRRANPIAVTLTEIEGAGHGIAYYTDTVKYEEAAEKACKATSGRD